MTTHLVAARPSPHSGTTGRTAQGTAIVVWTLVLASSSLPQIVYSEATGRNAPLWLALAQAGALLCVLAASSWVKGCRRLSGTVLWLLAMVVGWNLVISGVTGTDG